MALSTVDRRRSMSGDGQRGMRLTREGIIRAMSWIGWSCRICTGGWGLAGRVMGGLCCHLTSSCTVSERLVGLVLLRVYLIDLMVYVYLFICLYHLRLYIEIIN